MRRRNCLHIYFSLAALLQSNRFASFMSKLLAYLFFSSSLAPKQYVCIVHEQVQYYRIYSEDKQYPMRTSTFNELPQTRFNQLRLHLDLIYIANNDARRAFNFSPRIAPLETTPLIAYDAFGLDPAPIVSDIL